MPSRLSDPQLRALITLLADRDEDIVRRCRTRLLREGPRVRVFLDEAMESGPDDVKAAARGALRDLRALDVDKEIAAFAADPSQAVDLEAGAILIARTGDPDVDVEALRERLDKLATAVRDRVLIAEDPEDVAQALRSVLAEERGLAGNQSDYYDPDNSFLHRVLERGLGIPISLSVIYLLVARRAGLQVEGVGMPGHFVLRLGAERGFFLDPFNRGKPLTRDDCLSFLERTGFGRDASLLAPTPDRYILARMLANLLNVYKKRADPARAERYRRLFELFRGGAPL